MFLYYFKYFLIIPSIIQRLIKLEPCRDVRGLESTYRIFWFNPQIRGGVLKWKNLILVNRENRDLICGLLRERYADVAINHGESLNDFFQFCFKLKKTFLMFNFARKFF